MLDMKYVYYMIYETEKDYGSVNHAAPIQKHIVDLHPESVLDVGCGKGQFVEYLKSNNIEAEGVDIIFTGNNVIADARDLNMFDDDSFSLVTAFDVLEHFSQTDIDLVLAEMKRIAKSGMIFSICFRDSIFNIDGESLHRTVKPDSWWYDRLKEYGKVEPYNIQPTYGFYVVTI